MTDRPILFSAPMVRAHNDGRKTQTRRAIRMPDADFDAVFCEDDGSWHIGDALTGKREHKLPVHFRKGDRLWVKETWRTEARYDHLKPVELPRGALITYDADHEQEPNDGCRGKTRVSIHMVRRLSRTTLTVRDVRVQRLHEITEADCIAEGPPNVHRANYSGPLSALSGAMIQHPEKSWLTMTPRNWYRELWDAINGAGAWDRNPWVVAVTYSVEHRNIDA